MQKKNRAIILVVIFLVGFCLIRDFLIKSLIGTVTTSVIGAPTSVGGLSLSIIRQSVKISNFKIYNPKGFPKDILVEIPRISVIYNLKAFITGKIHLNQLGLEIKEIGMVKNKNGKLNVDSLKITAEKSKEKQKPAKKLSMRIDVVSLGMGRVVSRDYSVEGQPVIKVYDINLRKTYKNISSAQQLAALIISEPLKEAGIQGVAVYGVSVLTGVAALPVVAVFTFAGKDYAQEVFNVTAEKVYDAGLEVIKIAGKVTKESKLSGVIGAEVSGARVAFKLRKLSGKLTQVTISARKLGFPQPEIASGIMYQLSRKLK